jgi:hypothetical protein
MLKRANLAPDLGGQVDRIGFFQGQRAQNMLRVASNVVAGETVVIGPDTYIVVQIQTDTTKVTASGEWNNTNDPITVTITAHGLVAGDFLLVQSEMFKIISVVDADHLLLARARGGTSAATHADGQSIFKSAAPVAAGNIGVPLAATLTPAVFSPALAAEINNAASQTLEIYRCSAKSSTIYPRVTASSPSANVVNIFSKVSPGSQPSQSLNNNTMACTETLGGANNAWSAANMFGGAVPSQKRYTTIKRTPTAVEVAIGTMYIPIEFPARVVSVQVITTASGLNKAWVGAIAIDNTNMFVSIDNSGATDWATTDDVYVYIDE